MKFCTSPGNFRMRSAFATTARLLPTFGGDEFLRELKLADELRITERFFNGVEILAL